MRRQWILLASLAIAVLVLNPFPVNREVATAMRQGDLWWTEGKYTAALQAYGAAAERCPRCPQPHVRLGTVYQIQGRGEEAWQAYLDAIRRGGIDDEVRAGLARLYVAQDASAWAVDYLQHLVEHRPLRGDLWAELGDAYLAAGERTKAQEAFERALTLDLAAERRQAVHDRLGMMHIESDVERALSHLIEVEGGPDPTLSTHATRLIVALRGIIQGEEPALARAKLGEALFQRGDLALARRQFEAALKLEPDYVDGHTYLGHVLSLMGENDLAVHHLEQAIAVEPSYPLPYYFMGMHYVRKGWFVIARRYLEEAYDLEPSNPALCAAVADTYVRAEQPMYAVAEKWLRAAVSHAPDDVRFHLLLAHFYVDYMIDPAGQGIAVAQFAVRLAPQNSEAQETLGWAYHLADKPDLALKRLTYARDLTPDEPRVHYRIGEVYRTLRQSDLARASYQRAVDLDWNGSIGARARRAMEQQE